MGGLEPQCLCQLFSRQGSLAPPQVCRAAGAAIGGPESRSRHGAMHEPLHAPVELALAKRHTRQDDCGDAHVTSLGQLVYMPVRILVLAQVSIDSGAERPSRAADICVRARLESHAVPADVNERCSLEQEEQYVESGVGGGHQASLAHGR